MMRKLNRRHLLGLAAVSPLLAAMPVNAHGDHGHGSATPEASPHASAGTGTGAAYLTIINNGSEAERLIAASSDVSQTVELHTMTVENGVMTMKEMEDGIEIPAGKTVVLSPEDLHLMLIDLNQDILPDTTFDVDLTFERAGEVTITVAVAQAAPEDQEPITVGDLELSAAWSRPAPMLSPVATQAG